MADPPFLPESKSDTRDDSSADPRSALIASTPRWVKVFGIMAIVLVLLLIIHLLTGGGPGMHGMHAPAAGGQTP